LKLEGQQCPEYIYVQSWDFNTLVHFKLSAIGIRISFQPEIHIPIQFKDKEEPYSSSAIPEVKIPGIKIWPAQSQFDRLPWSLPLLLHLAAYPQQHKFEHQKTCIP
jgi:hypothetical protein